MGDMISCTVKKEHRNMFENKLLRSIVFCMGGEIAGEWRKLLICTLNFITMIKASRIRSCKILL
jgi:hypothetical protein